MRSFAKSIRCSQSTAIVAPREAMFIAALLQHQFKKTSEIVFSVDKKQVERASALRHINLLVVQGLANGVPSQAERSRGDW